MPAIPPVVDGLVKRMYGKGAVLLIGATNAYPTIPSTFYLVSGVTKISGPESKRTGKVDCTELAPQPWPEPSGGFPAEVGETLSGITERSAETYFYAKYCGGTKEEQPITISMNLSTQMMYNLRYYYRRDVYNYYRILFRDQTFFSFWAYIEEMPVQSGEENKLVSAEVQFQPFPDVTYFLAAVPTLAIPPAYVPN